MKFDDFCQALYCFNVIDELAIEDADDYDGGVTSDRVFAAYNHIGKMLEAKPRKKYTPKTKQSNSFKEMGEWLEKTCAEIKEKLNADNRK